MGRTGSSEGGLNRVYAGRMSVWVLPCGLGPGVKRRLQRQFGCCAGDFWPTYSPVVKSTDRVDIERRATEAMAVWAEEGKTKLG